ncbi:MAG: hypothetical protein Kow0098_01500 [Ignavibacteriaceae bacterium]
MQSDDVFRTLTENQDESESRFRFLFNNINDAIFVIKLSSNKSYGDFIEVNDVACSRLGYTREEFLRLSPSAIVPPGFIEEYNSVIERLPDEKHVIFELAHKAKDRRIIPVEISAHIFTYNNSSTVLAVARDITERKRTEEKIGKTTKRLRDLAIHLQSVREEERSLISREIHDELGQVLTFLKIQISLISKKLKEDQQDLKTGLEEASAIIEQSVDTVQRICTKLRPDILDDLGLIAAIEWQAQELRRVTGISCNVNITTDEINDLSSEKATAIFRIYQEALTNAVRHSGASQIRIYLYKRNDYMTLEISDNGKGITNEQISAPASLGILGMKERALVFGGEVYIDNAGSGGTRVKVSMPLSDKWK